MYTQNTPVHVKLWHREFWYLALSNLLLTMSVYMLIPILPQWLLTTFSPMQTGVVMGVYGIGLYLMGGFCSALVQHYRRNQVCLVAIISLALTFGALYYVLISGVKSFFLLSLIRLLCGVSFGFTQMVQMSTLIIDTCESFQRTEANHSATWFSRFALSLGPLAACIISRFGVSSMMGLDLVLLAALCCCAVSALLIMIIKFPFKAPEDKVCAFTLDRFFLPQGFWIFLNLLLFSTALGIILSIPHKPMFYAMMMTGFLIALLSQKFVFENAELKSEIISGLFLVGCALLMQYSHQTVALNYISPVFIGTGTGIVGARFLLFFIKLSRHCQRGTSQSTYFLGWETGLSLGLFIGYALLHDNQRGHITCALVLVVVALLMYDFFTHTWYLKHKNR